MRRVMEPRRYRGSSDRTAAAARWLDIAGGVLFAIAYLVSPVVIASAVAITCLVRYQNTLDASRNLRWAAAIASAMLLAAIPVSGALIFEESAALVPALAVVSVALMIAALAIGAANPPADDDPGRSESDARVAVASA